MMVNSPMSSPRSLEVIPTTRGPIMPKSEVAKRAAKLREQKGFDKSYVTEDKNVRVRCSQCQAMVINGVPVHERGCPNERR